MSSAQVQNAAPPPMPAHHVHNSSDPLPTRSAGYGLGTPGGGSTTDNYVPESPGEVEAASRTATAGDHSAFTEQRPLDTQPAPEGGVSRGGQEGLPEGKANFADKLVGKTEKLIGKATKDPEMHEKGELRESGGKAAAVGEARAPHD